jgi:hypothetical protein
MGEKPAIHDITFARTSSGSKAGSPQSGEMHWKVGQKVDLADLPLLAAS